MKYISFGIAIILPLSLFAADGEQTVDRKVKPDTANVLQKVQIDAGTQVKFKHQAVSPDKKLIAGFYRDGWDETISIHDAKTGKRIQRIVGHGDNVQELKFSKEGKFLATRCSNTGRKGWALWDVANGKLIMRLPDSEVSTGK